MRKLLSMLLAMSMMLTMLAACNTEPVDAVENPDQQQEEEIQPDEPEKEVVKVEQWLANEIKFVSSTEYEDPVYTVDMDVIFTNTTTGKTFTMPAFWDGGTSWKVRYALTELGDWTWTTTCTDETNTGLHGLSGEVSCVEYTGELDIYKHGFIKTEPGVRYFMYADGTPFFYLGDTHWTLPLENIDGINPDVPYERVMITQETADQYGITSMFKYIIDYRAEQGFTVIQSQQLGLWNGVSGNSWIGDTEGSIFTYGVNDMILSKFSELDRYFKYIAEKGFVHANAQLTYPTTLVYAVGDEAVTEEEIDKLCRYWVARYSAYPVIWTTTQEGDNDVENPHYEYNGGTLETNPWKTVMESIAKYDPYDHPSTCHQRHAKDTRVENSSFGSLESHSWYATQYSSVHKNGKQLDWPMFKEYWNNPGSKPVIAFEGHYDHYWCGTIRARSQGWIAFTNGQFGYGYGSQPIWSLSWGGADDYTVPEDDVETWTLDLTWLEGLYSEASTQLTYMKNFLEKYEWWNLEPCFNYGQYLDDYYYKNAGQNFSVATIGNKLYIGYFYGSTFNNDKLGTFYKMENADYEVVWMNCVTGEYTEPEIVTITDGTYNIPAKVNDEDWVIAVRLIEN